MPIKPVLKSAANEKEGLIEEVHLWTGINKDLLRYHLAEEKDELLSMLARTLKVIGED